MSFSEEQIRFFVRDELRKILDKGLMYSAEAKPQPKPTPKAESKLSQGDILEKFPEELRRHLTVEEGGRVIRTEYVSCGRWEEINAKAKELGYKWISDKKNSRWEKA